MDSLIIKKPFLDRILSGEKTWELRGSKTHKRGKIGLIESGSGRIVGECELIDCKGPLSQEEYENNKSKHMSKAKYEEQYKKLYAWILKNPERYKKPINYKHPQGAIIWVKINSSAKNKKNKEIQRKLTK